MHEAQQRKMFFHLASDENFPDNRLAGIQGNMQYVNSAFYFVNLKIGKPGPRGLSY